MLTTDVEVQDAADHHNNEDGEVLVSSSPQSPPTQRRRTSMEQQEQPPGRAGRGGGTGLRLPPLSLSAMSEAAAAVSPTAGTATTIAAAGAAVATATAAAVVGPRAMDTWRKSVAKAEAALRGGQYESAINEYTHLIRTALPLLLPPGVTTPLPTSPTAAVAAAAGPAHVAATAPTADAAAASAAAVARWRDTQLSTLLLGRAQAYAALSASLRAIPAAQSESRAIYAPDPCHLASLGLKDSEGALALGAGALGQLARGRALLLLERYTEAEEALLAGLQEHPTLPGLQQHLEECRAAAATALERPAGSGAGSPAATMCEEAQPTAAPAAQQASARAAQGSGRRLRHTDDAECTLCMRLLWEPVTTPCGHTFCRPCYQRSTDHTSRCPLCRTVLHVGRDLPVTVTLKALLERSFPEEYAARKAEESAAAAAAAASEAPLPLFVMSAMLPGERMALNIFEPRYRLMVRRCMEGARRFGMATVDSRHELHPVACEVEIIDCQPQPDGRFYIEILGKRRFKPTRTWEQDGYRVAVPEHLSDDAPEGEAAAAELAEAAAEVSALADTWVERLRGLAQMRRGAAELIHRAGDKPPASDPEALSFYVANLICPILDQDDLKLQLMVTTSTLERLRKERELLQQLCRAQCNGCCVM